MNPLPYLLAPILLLPAVAGPVPVPASDVTRDDPALAVARDATRAGDDGAAGMSRALDLPAGPLPDRFQPENAGQVRIEQSVTIRIAPRTPGRADPRATAFDEPAERRVPRPRLVEKAMAKCLPVQSVAGVQISPANRLVLYLHDSRVVSAGLDKGCNARDFYSGFYVARTADGMMCAGRDKLQARNGASCKLGKMKQVVVVDD